MNVRRKWEPQDVERLVTMHEGGLSFTDCGRALNRSTDACSNKYYYASCPAGSAGPPNQPRANPELIEARDVRLEASYRRDLTATLFGDPPPGYSALDVKRGVRT